MKLKLYLATVNISRRTYMSDHDDVFVKTHIVRASSGAEAIKKVTKYYDDQTDEYSVYYRVGGVEITEEIF
jgi:hypothetical protein